MPIYAYRCGACGHSRDVLQKLSDPLLTTCPVCAAEAFTKQVTAAGFQLKGSGWYVTDFRDNGSGKKAQAQAEGSPEAKGDGAAAPAADGKADAKGEVKAEAKGESKADSSASATPAGAPAAAPAPAAAAPAAASSQPG